MTEQQQPGNQPGIHYSSVPPQPGQQYPQPHYQPGGYVPPWPAAPEPRNALGLTALILGIVGLLFGIVPLTGFIAFGLGATGLIFGLSNLGRLRRGRATNKVTTGFGIATSLGAVALGIIGMVIFFSALNDFGDDLDQIGDDLDQYSQCIDDAETTEQMAACEVPE